MADFNSSLPVRTETAGDVKVQIVDKTTTSQAASVDASGNVSVLVQNTTGAPANVQDLADGPVSPGTAATKSMLAGAVFNSSAPTLTTGQQASLQANASGALKVDGSAVTQPVSGTVTVTQATAGNLNATVTGTVAATQSGTWNITNVSGTVSLPTGAATEATLTKLPIAQGTALGSNSGPLMQGSVTTAAPTYTTGNINPLSLTTGGLLRVDASGSTIPVSFSVDGSAVSKSNPMPVYMQDSPGTEINNYNTATVAAAGTSNHDYTVTATFTLRLSQIWAT